MMTNARYRELMSNPEMTLTADELASGYHFCVEYDGDVVGPGMSGCTCLKNREQKKEQSMDMPRLVKQRGPTTCGQACVATLLEISLDEAISRIGHDGITDEYEIAFAVATDLPFVEGPPSSSTIAIQKHRDPNGSREHWTVSWRGTTLDPACIGKRLWPVVKHVEIDWAKYAGIK